MRGHLRDLAHALLVFAAAAVVTLAFMAAAGGYGLAVFLGACLVPGLVVTWVARRRRARAWRVSRSAAGERMRQRR